MRKSAYITGVVISLLFLFTIVLYYTLLNEDRRNLLTVSFLNIGQGDSIFIDSPTGRQIIIDGGPDAGVLRKLSDVMPWYDRTIDVMIATHPDSDHIAGLIDVLKRYQVGTIITSPVLGNSSTLTQLYKSITQEGAHHIIARRGQHIDIGGGAYLEVLSPDRDLESVDTNTACVVTRLVYGKTAFMLPCDAPQDIEKYLVHLDGTELQSNVLKAGHHGSHTASSPLFVGTVNPQYVVYSRGCNNKYGFPHPQTLTTMKAFGIKELDTCQEGTVTFTSDGTNVMLK